MINVDYVDNISLSVIKIFNKFARLVAFLLLIIKDYIYKKDNWGIGSRLNYDRIKTPKVPSVLKTKIFTAEVFKF